MESPHGVTREDVRMLWQHAKDAGFTAASFMRMLALINLDSTRMSVQDLTTLMPYVNDLNARKFRYKGE